MGRLAIQGLAGHLDNQDHLAHLVIKDNLGLLDNLGSKVLKVLLGLREQVEHQEMECRDQLV